MDRDEYFYKIMLAGLNVGADGVKLWFTVSTGSVVLFVNLLQSHELNRWEVLCIALSVISFGITSCVLIPAFVSFGNIHNALAGVARTNSLKALEASNIEVAQTQKITGLAQWPFYFGVCGALAFVLLHTFLVFHGEGKHLDLTMWS